ncbi:MAG: tandem-95 repeat protein [Phycisphaerales bacterium]|nr:MAG: tandem-95 repeat protein [Phycisphaerales bacterium]
MKRLKKNLPRTFLRTALVYLLIYGLVLNVSLPAAMALGPDDMTGSSGVIGDPAWGEITTIQTDHGAIIEWDNFNTSSTEGVTFEQYLGGALDPVSAVLNRISSGTAPTQFDGALTANGRVFVVNPAGVIFGSTSVVNVTQLVASGLNMSDDAFAAVLADEANRMEFSGGSGQVENHGQIEAASVYLIGKKVANFGSIIAPDGLIIMAASDRVYLAQDGSNILVRMDADPVETTPDVRNEGSVTAENGSIVLAAGDRFARAISNVGTLAAEAGSITADAGRIVNSGTVSADPVDTDTGTISLSASEAVVLKGSGTITADGGTVMIEAPELTIADGSVPAEPPENTLYEKWIEAQSEVGTDLELVAGSSTHGTITVENIKDGEITGGTGDLALRTKYDTGGIIFEPAAEGEPVSTAIHTTDGANVYMLAGAGGITIGDVSTDIPSSDKINDPGKIRLFTNNDGIIETGHLTVEGGSYDEVSIIAAGDLIVHGNVETVTNQVPSDTQEIGEARTCLVSLHGDVDIEGEVLVDAHGKSFSTADVHICAGANVTITLSSGQRIEASAHTSESGPSQASVAIHAGKYIEGPGVITINGGGASPVHVYAKAGGGAGTAEVYDSDDPADWDEEVNAVYDGEGNLIAGAHATLEIEPDREAQCPDCPLPPDLPPPVPPISLPDEATIHMGVPVTGNVLDNDTPPEGKTLTVILVDEPQHGELTEFDWETGDFTYEPDPGYVGPDTFTYIATDGEFYTDPIPVTIIMANTLPSLGADAVSTGQGIPILINVLANDSDPDLDPLSVDSFIYAGSGTLVLNPNGTFSYTPPAGFAGQDSFTYYASDGQLDAELPGATVNITVNPAPVLPFVPPAPLPELVELEVSGCPALLAWAAAEIGVDGQVMQIWFANRLASSRSIQPCDTCARLKGAATLLADADGTRLAALNQVLSEFAPGAAPPTQEQMTSIADAIANNTVIGRNYAQAGEYLDALAQYVGIMTQELDFSAAESVRLAADSYLSRLAETEDPNVTGYLAARLMTLAQQ